MVTEWNTREIDGLELLNRMRRDRQSPSQTLHCRHADRPR